MNARQFWAFSFVQILGWQYHPGAKSRLTIEECAALADLWLAEYVRRFPCPLE